MRLRRLLVLITSFALVAVAGITGIAPASAEPDQTLIANTSPMGQTNGRVWTLVHAGGVLYAGGEFTSTRPSGAAAGTGEVARGRLAAFSSQTGQLLSLNHSFDGTVRGLALSPDQKTLYAVGAFTTVNGVARGRGAAIDLTTGALTGWNPRLSNTAWSVDVTSSTVYVGGVFGQAAGLARIRLAAFEPVTGDPTPNVTTVLPWAPQADGYVRTLKVAPDGSRVLVGGGFNNLNGQAMRALGAVESGGTGALVPGFPNGIIPTVAGAPTTGGCCFSDATFLSSDGQYMYVSAEGTGGGVFDGSVKFDPTDGRILWRDTCLGATQAVLPLNGTVYKASHAHDCSGVAGGFPQVASTSAAYHLLALDQETGALEHWYPTMNGGGGLGPRVFATDGTQLFVGGEFTQAANKGQQGLARFGTTLPGLAPKKPATPTASVQTSGGVVVRFSTTWDPDDATVTYDLFRNSQTSTPIATVVKESRPYSMPRLSYTDTGVANGASARYWVRASDGRSVTWSSVSNTVVGGQPPATYSAAVTGDGADMYWRLGEGSAATVAADSTSDAVDTGNYTAGTTRGHAGVLSGNTAARFNGSDGAVNGTRVVTNPQGFTVEAWVKTTTTRGGKVIGFGNSQGGVSNNYDRHIYLTNSGSLVFGVYNNGVNVVTASKKVNDGQWHHLVGTSDENGLALYVDGLRVGRNATATVAQNFTGYWKVGGDNIGGWPSQPASNFLDGDIDEVAVYPHALLQEDVEEHYTLSGNVVTPPPPPPSSCTGGQFLAKYWNSMDLTGDPALTRCEASIDYDWGNGSPGEEVNVDNFSARWEATRSFAAGAYTFETLSDDGIRVYVDGSLVIDNWTDHGPTINSAVVPLTAGEHTIRVDFYENGGGAVARLAITP